MCLSCIDALQREIDGNTVELAGLDWQIIVHLDDDWATAIGEQAGTSLPAGSAGLHLHTDAADCWCRPIVARSGDGLSAEDYYNARVGEGEVTH